MDTRSPKKEEAQQEPPTKPTITDVFSEGDTGDVRILAKHVDQGFFLAEVTMFKNNQEKRVRVWWPFDEPDEPGTGSNAPDRLPEKRRQSRPYIGRTTEGRHQEDERS